MNPDSQLIKDLQVLQNRVNDVNTSAMSWIVRQELNKALQNIISKLLIDDYNFLKGDTTR